MALILRMPFSGRVKVRTLIPTILAVIALYLVFTSFAGSHSVDPKYGQLGLSSTRYAYTTLLTSEDEAYFTATRVLAYQLLADPETKTHHSIPFVVMVTKSVPRHQRQQLVLDGATVVFVEDVALPWWIRQRLRRPSRFGDQFTKLRVLQMLEYDRVLYLDADTLLMRSLDGIFQDPAVITPSNTQISRHSIFAGDDAPMPAQYVFAARPDNGRSNDGSSGGSYEHPIPPMERDQLSAGFWIAAPSNELYNHYMSVMASSTLGVFRPFDPQFMEQAMFNHVHRRGDGSMPWKSLDYKWSATFPNVQDVEAGIASLHDKFWLHGPEPLMARWKQKKLEMEVASNTTALVKY
jgi:alpha-N-acetylglucosamine transferase